MQKEVCVDPKRSGNRLQSVVIVFAAVVALGWLADYVLERSHPRAEPLGDFEQVQIMPGSARAREGIIRLPDDFDERREYAFSASVEPDEHGNQLIVVYGEWYPTLGSERVYRYWKHPIGFGEYFQDIQPVTADGKPLKPVPVEGY